ncbi:MAG TPA: isocitrate lyase/phosphoenolpyruvate mutase family protein [Amycolatopsis sp.]|jgi:2-methylisocitrate lyase-like PEP mutase family enzyme
MTFAELHQGPEPLVLPNAWDVPSALALVAEGFPAIGTTSFGVASSQGNPDGGRASRDANLALARALRALPVYVSVDIEDGYSDDPAEVAAYVEQLAVAGINIEDSTAERLVAPELLAAKVAEIKRRSPGLFVNARVDTYWLRQDAEPAPTLERAAAYVRAGADGVFVPGATDPALLRELAETLPVPVNTLPVPGLSVNALGRLGIRRVSTGSLPYRAALNAAVEAARAVRDGLQVPHALDYQRMQEQLTGYRDSAPVPELQVIARYQVLPGNEEQVDELLARLTTATRSEPGNLAFAAYHGAGEIVLLERYASREAFAQHRETGHFTELVLGRIVPLLESRTVEVYDVTS